MYKNNIQETRPVVSGGGGTGGNELPKLLYTIKDTARILSMSEKSVRRLLDRGLLKSSKALRTKLITAESIRNFASITA